MRRWKTVYVSVPKAACTSLKWLVADLQEEDPAALLRDAERGDLAQHDHPPPVPVAAHPDAQRARRRGARRDQPGERLVRLRRSSGTRRPGCGRAGSRSSCCTSRTSSSTSPRRRGRASPRPRATWSRTSTRSCAAWRPTRRQPIFHDRHFRSQSRLLRTDRVPYTPRLPDRRVRRADARPRGAPRAARPRADARAAAQQRDPLGAGRAAVHPRGGRHASSGTTPPTSSSSATRTSYPRGCRASEYSAAELAEVGRLAERGERIGDLYRLLLESQAPAARGDPGAPDPAAGPSARRPGPAQHPAAGARQGRPDRPAGACPGSAEAEAYGAVGGVAHLDAAVVPGRAGQLGLPGAVLPHEPQPQPDVVEQLLARTRPRAGPPPDTANPSADRVAVTGSVARRARSRGARRSA